MSNFQQLQDKHIKLLQSHEKHKESPELLKEVKEYTEEVVNASREIGDSRERNQLRANLRFWGAYIYDQTGTYPNLNLLPSEGGTAAPPPKAAAINIRWVIIVPLILILLTAVYLGGRFRFTRYSNSQSSGQSGMSDIEVFATGTAVAVATQLAIDPADIVTQTAVPTPLTFPTATAALYIPTTGGGGLGFIGHAYASTEIQDDISCSSQRINIKILNGFATDKSVEPAILTISEEGSFNKVVERQISLTAGDSLVTINEEINTEINIPDARGSYLIYIDHPKLTFDAVIIQHLPDCRGNLTNIAYVIPSDDYDQLESRPNLGVNFNLVAWGPNPVIDTTSIYYGIANIRVNSTENATNPIFWIFSGDSEKFELLQNDEFIAVSDAGYYIGVTFAGKTVSIPFVFVTPYIGYIQNQ